jgi:hypothetical protein
VQFGYMIHKSRWETKKGLRIRKPAFLGTKNELQIKSQKGNVLLRVRKTEQKRPTMAVNTCRGQAAQFSTLHEINQLV